MYQVTQEYQRIMQADMRQVLARVVIDYTDPLLDQSLQVQVTNNARISWPAHVADGIKKVPYQRTQLDDSWTLDQMRRPMPDTAELAELYQVGWYGQYPADASGNLTGATPALTVTHYPRPVHSLRVVGEPVRGEYPVDFTIKLYSADNTLLHTETVSSNDKVEWSIKLEEPVLDVVRQELYMQTWSHPNQVPKIVEFFSSIQQIYEADDLLDLHVLEEREANLGNLAVGNVSSNEIKVALSNEDRRFDPDNESSPLYRLVKPRRRIRAWLGTEIDGVKEWVPLGTYWATDWDTDDDALQAMVTGRDRLELLQKTEYKACLPQQNVSLYTLAESVLVDAGLQASEYVIDTALQAIVLPWGYLPPMSHREALRVIAEAALAVVYADRDGRIRVELPGEITPGESVAAYLQPQYPADIIDSGLYAIGPDDYYRVNAPSRQEQLANEVVVPTQPLTLDAPQEIYRSEPIEMTPEDEITVVTVEYNKKPAIETNISITVTPEEDAYMVAVDIVEQYAWGAKIRINNWGHMIGHVSIVATGKPLSVQGSMQAVERDEISITDNGLLHYEFPANPLVQTLDRARAIAQTLLTSSKDPKRDIEIDWRGNPALELGDGIHVITDAKRERRSNYIVIRQELEWSGALRARLAGRRLE